MIYVLLFTNLLNCFWNRVPINGKSPLFGSRLTEVHCMLSQSFTNGNTETCVASQSQMYALTTIRRARWRSAPPTWTICALSSPRCSTWCREDRSSPIRFSPRSWTMPQGQSCYIWTVRQIELNKSSSHTNLPYQAIYVCGLSMMQVISWWTMCGGGHYFLIPVAEKQNH